ncbi:MAG: PAS domain S-box protein [Bacteroidetes bacterium]|nr:PAS domain S-box protein [Bacteroidota bacterium]
MNDKKKRGLETLKKDENIYRNIFENMVEVLYRTDNEEKITIISPSAINLFGYDSVNDFIGKNVPENFYHNPADRKVFLEELSQHGKVVNYPLTLKRKDGSLIYARTTSYFIYDEKGNPIGVEGIIMDTSRQYQVEQALKQAGDIVDHIQLGIYIYQLEDINDDRTLRMVAANPASEKLTGVAVKNIIGKTLDENFPGLREKGIPQQYAEVVRSRKPIELDDIFYGDDCVISGAFSVKAFPLPNNQVGVSFENITNRKKTEEALIKSEEKHRQLIEIMNEGLAILDKHGIITYANSRLIEMTGYKRDEILNHPTTDFLDKTDIENMQKHVTSRSERRSVPYEVEWVKKDGSKLPTIVSPAPLFNKEGKFEGNFAVLTDVSELKKIEHELIVKNEELEKILKKINEMHTQLVICEKMASIGQITAGVAHEIKNPVNFITGNIEPLKRDVNDLLSVIEKYESLIQKYELEHTFTEIASLKNELDYPHLLEEVNKLIEGMEEGANRTAQIIKSLGSFSRVDKDEFVKVDIHEGIDSTLTLLGNKIKHRITVHKDYKAVSNIECLPSKLNQVFMNVLTNAIQAIDKKGKIFIKTSSDEKNVDICIKDTGKGMTEEIKKHIFEPFYTTKDISKGIGLGLSISYSIIKKHNGRIVVNSEPGKGTEFIITLPIEQSPKNENS